MAKWSLLSFGWFYWLVAVVAVVATALLERFEDEFVIRVHADVRRHLHRLGRDRRRVQVGSVRQRASGGCEGGKPFEFRISETFFCFFWCNAARTRKEGREGVEE